MKATGRFGILLFLTALIASCVQPVQYSAKDETFLQNAERKVWKKVAVLPFTGDPAFRRVSAEWLAFVIRKHGLFEIIGPEIAETDLKEKGFAAGEAELPIEKACAAGRSLGADAVIVGSIKQHSPGGVGLWPVAGVSIVDIVTCKVLATSIQSSQTVFTEDKQKFVISATENVALDIATVLHAAAGRPWTSPKKEDRSSNGTRGVSW